MNYLGEVTISTDVLTLGVRPNQYTFPTQAGEDGELLRSQDGNLIFGAGDHTLLTNTGVTTHANLDAFKAGVEAMVDQDVRTLSTPSFASINTDTVNNAAGFRVVDKAITDVTHLHSGANPITYSGYNIRCAVGSTRIDHGSDNTASYLDCTKDGQLFKVAGFEKVGVTSSGVTLNPNSADSYTLPQNRGADGHGLVSDGVGGVDWEDVLVTDHGQLRSVGVSSHAELDTFKSGIEAQVDQDVRTVATPTFLGLQLDSDYNATMIIRRGGQIKWTIQNNGAATDDALVIRRNAGSAVMTFRGYDTIQIGDSSTYWTLPQTRGLNGQFLQSNSQGVCDWVDPPGRSYANIRFLNNTTPTPLPTQNAYEVVRGARQGTVAADFTLNPGPPEQQPLVYRGSRPKFFKVTQSVAWEAEGKSEQFTQAIFKNGVLVQGSQMRSELDGKPSNSTSTAIVELTELDTIAGFVKCDTDDTDALIHDYQLTVVEVG